MSPRETWELDDLPPRYRAQAEAQIADADDRRKRRRAAQDPGPRPRTENRKRQTEPFSIDLPIEPWSMNEERAGHWSVHRMRTAAVREIVGAIVRSLDVGRYEDPVEIEATPRGVKHDPGNSYPTVKAAIDALVDVGILAGDTGAYVARIILNAPVAGEPGLILCVRRVQL